MVRGDGVLQPPAVETWAARVLRESTSTVVAFVFLVALLRTGFARYVNPVGLDVAASLPEPITEYRGGAVLSPILARFLGVDTFSAWTVLHAVLTVGLAVLIVWLIWRRFADRDQRLFVLVAIGASSIPVVSLIHAGHYDVWTLAGGVTITLSRTMWGSLIGGVMIGLTNTEQGLVALATLIVVAALVDRPFAHHAAAALVAVVACAAAVRGWYAVTDTPRADRSAYLIPEARQSISQFAQSLPIQVYSWFSAAWIVVASVVRSWTVLGVLVIPAAATVLALDGTRVFVAVSTPVFVFLVARAADTMDRATLERLTAWTLVIMCVTPGLSTFSNGLVEVPLVWLPRGWSPF